MDLLRAVQGEKLEKIKEIVLSKGIPVNSKWLDYAILNSALECRRKNVATFLLDRGCRVNKTTKSAATVTTPLHHAVKLDDIELVTKLLEKKASIVAVNTDGDTPLHLAFMSRNDPIVDVMLPYVKHTKYTNPKDKRGLTHMHIACIRNNAEVVKNFLQSGVDVEISINSDSSMWPGYTPLHFAIDFKCLDVVIVLLAANANVLSWDKNKIKPLSQIREISNDVSMIEYFVSGENKEKVLKYHNRISNFHIACMKNDSSLVESFLRNGAAVNNPTCRSSALCPLYTPLHFAVESNCKENVEILLRHGAHVEYQNEYYMTPLHLALYNDKNSKSPIVNILYTALKNKDKDCSDLNGLTYFHIACTQNNVELVKYFIDECIHDVNDQILYNVRNFAHYTPLHFAVQYRCKEVVDVLIKRGANVNRSDNGMRGTPLHVAFESGNTEIIELLLNNGARANAIRPFDDKTMLHLFVREVMNRSYENEDIQSMISLMSKKDSDVDTYIKKLVNLGCDINAQDSDGNTALHLACSKLRDGFTCAEALLEWGADINIENSQEFTPFDQSFCDVYRMNAESYMTLYHHVKKLKALGMKVNPKNEKCCVKLITEKDNCNADAECFTEKSLALKQLQRISEVTKMKNTRIDKRASLYDLLFENSKKLASKSRIEAFRKILERKDFKKEYPSYGNMLKLQFQRGLDAAGVEEIFDKVDDEVEPPMEPRAKRHRAR